jgi:hypothetical protein
MGDEFDYGGFDFGAIDWSAPEAQNFLSWIGHSPQSEGPTSSLGPEGTSWNGDIPGALTDGWTPPVAEEPGFWGGLQSIASKVGGSFASAFEKNPMAFISAGLGAGLAAYGLFKDTDGTYKEIATGRQIQLSPQEQQLFDTLNQQIKDRQAVQQPFLNTYQDVLGSPEGQANLKSLFGGSLDTLNKQSQGQNYLTDSIYKAGLGTLDSRDPFSTALNQTYSNANARDSLLGDYQTMIGNRGFTGPPTNLGFDAQAKGITNFATDPDNFPLYNKSVGIANYATDPANFPMYNMGVGIAQGAAGFNPGSFVSQYGMSPNSVAGIDQYLMAPNQGAGMQAAGQGLFGQGAAELGSASANAAADRSKMNALYGEMQSDPVIAMLQERALASGDPSSMEQQIIDAYNQRVLGGLTGEGELDPRLERQQADQLQALKEQALRSYGPGYETTSFYQSQLSDLLARQNEADFTNRRQILTTDNEQRLASIKQAQDQITQITQALYQGKLTNAQAFSSYAQAFAALQNAQTELGGTMASAGTGAFNAGTAANKAAGDVAASIYGVKERAAADAAASNAALLNAGSNWYGAQMGAAQGLAGTDIAKYNALMNSAEGLAGVDVAKYNALMNSAIGLTGTETNRMTALQGIENSIFNNVLNSSPSGLQTIGNLASLSQQGSLQPSQALGMMAGSDPTALTLSTFNSMGNLSNQSIQQQLAAYQASQQQNAALLGAGGSLLGNALGSYLYGGRPR